MLHESFKLLDRQLLDRLNVVAEEVYVLALKLLFFLADEVNYLRITVTKVANILFDFHN